MALTKNVNGIDIALSPAEEAEIRAFWAANDASKAAKPEPVSEKDRLTRALATLLGKSETEVTTAFDQAAISESVKPTK